MNVLDEGLACDVRQGFARQASGLVARGDVDAKIQLEFLVRWNTACFVLQHHRNIILNRIS